MGPAKKSCFLTLLLSHFCCFCIVPFAFRALNLPVLRLLPDQHISHCFLYGFAHLLVFLPYFDIQIVINSNQRSAHQRVLASKKAWQQFKPAAGIFVYAALSRQDPPIKQVRLKRNASSAHRFALEGNGHRISLGGHFRHHLGRIRSAFHAGHLLLHPFNISHHCRHSIYPPFRVWCCHCTWTVIKGKIARGYESASA